MVDALHELIGRLGGLRALVIGDLMLDEYVWGRVERISPEAPVPVVSVDRRSYRPGGAANVARNAADLGAQVSVVGVVGDDPDGGELLAALSELGADTEAVLRDGSRPTSRKTRLIAHNQQLLRVDTEAVAPLADDLAGQVVHAASDGLEQADVVIFSDYAKGMLSAAVTAPIMERAKTRSVPVVAGPKPPNLGLLAGARGVSLNRAEAQACTGVAVEDERSAAAAAEGILHEGDCGAVFLTLGGQGICVLERGGPPHHVPAVPAEVADGTGAGDTALSLLALALAAGASALEAAALANLGGSLVVRRVGCATATPEELAAAATRNGHHLQAIRSLEDG